MATIIIQRKKAFLYYNTRDFKIYLDGEKVADIASEESQTIITHTGPHQIKVKLDWLSSPDYHINLAEDETIVFKIDHSNSFLKLFYTEVILLFHLILSSFFDYNKLIIKTLILPVIILELYFLTFGRNRYFNLKKIEEELITSEA